MKNKIPMFFSLMIVSILALAIMVSAYRGNYETKDTDCSDERHELMIQAFDNLDYNLWKELMDSAGKKSRVLNVVNEENFHLFVEAHHAGKSGNYELAQELRAELGLNNGMGPKDGSGFGKSQGFGEMKGRGQGAGHGKLFKNK